MLKSMESPHRHELKFAFSVLMVIGYVQLIDPSQPFTIGIDVVVKASESMSRAVILELRKD